MIGLILTLAVCGFLVWLLVTYVPMPPIFRTVIVVIVVLFVIIYLISLFGVGDIPIPHLRR